ncbi:cation:proton antiporter [Sphingosinicella rhizophila]|uniref:Cation:proton antiporter n=1 Tax=Sphingosinicella rhizophila TaxID=3050082 RepID=A0ABU3QAP7_9SPHN|nr:cation:proton antiporter [Sphingosinicella sp. GR2756]MDT9600480.1 cation:proton antiporter [Sphingosinicella sp. GR2756]
MADSHFFGLASYHVAITAIGAGIILSFWIPRFVSGREPAASALLILFGLIAFSFLPGMPAALDPRTAPKIWEYTSELAVIVALFGTGLRIDNLRNYRRWQPTVRLLAVVMPLTILAVALLGWALAGMTLAGALLLGAVLAPTDPVLAGDVQVGPPTEGGEHPVRFSLTTEAGLNDGLAFPFVYLGLIVAAEGFAPGSWAIEWLARDVVYRIGIGAASGAAIGWLLGRILFAIPARNVLADTGSGVLALAGVLLCYGATELIEGYGFIAAFVAGLALRRAEAGHEFHGTLHGFNEAIEHALTAILLIMIGGVLPVLWPELDWRHIAIGLALILVIRPLAGWWGLRGTPLRPRERFVVGAYGVRGIGSIYYLAYATSHLEFVNEGQLWATIAFTVATSTVIHGLSASTVVERVTQEESGEDA